LSALEEEIKTVRASHPDWSFETSWIFLTENRPQLFKATAESNRIAAQLRPQKEKEAQEEFDRVEGIARRLMARNGKLTFGAALEMVRLCSPKPGAPNAKPLLEAKAVESVEPKIFLVRGIECSRELEYGLES
jgi:hypothetical protein